MEFRCETNGIVTAPAATGDNNLLRTGRSQRQLWSMRITAFGRAHKDDPDERTEKADRPGAWSASLVVLD